jgi:dephospho-CoA kinase
MIIGITGGIGSGKTMLASMLRSKGYVVYDTDFEARKLQNSDPELIREIKNLFGDDIYVDEKLNRPAVASIVFNKPEILQKLTALVHPVVKNDILKLKNDWKHCEMVFIESAVLFEGGFDTLTDKVILVTASEEVRISRIIKRDHFNEQQIRNRMKNQIPEHIKAQRSDFIINTDNELPENAVELIEIWKNRIIS